MVYWEEGTRARSYGEIFSSATDADFRPARGIQLLLLRGGRIVMNRANISAQRIFRHCKALYMQVG